MLKRFAQQVRNMHINYIPMRWGTGDNYCYLLTDEATKKTWIIDPAEPDEVIPQLKKFDVDIVAIVNTHHHYDHAGGNQAMAEKFPGVPLIAGEDSPGQAYSPSHYELIQVGENIDVTCLRTPCHTQDSICYWAEDKTTGESAVFTGDTLFTSGCGRFFEGTPAQMNKSLNEILAKLPPRTKVYPGHEYTKSNVKFSRTMLDNDELRLLEKYANEHEFTTGKFTIGDELKFNPFMRLSDPQIREKLGLTDPVEIMGKLRELKNKL